MRVLVEFPCWIAGWGNKTQRGHKGDLAVGWIGARLEAKIIAKIGSYVEDKEDTDIANNQGGGSCVVS